MARAKEFEARTALAAAMKVFWRLGYENTSLETLIRETGVAKQSLYDTFGDKRALYLIHSPTIARKPTPLYAVS
jgi:TetR/AcrR family transcriptional repressor of nem operon